MDVCSHPNGRKIKWVDNRQSSCPCLHVQRYQLLHEGSLNPCNAAATWWSAACKAYQTSCCEVPTQILQRVRCFVNLSSSTPQARVNAHLIAECLAYNLRKLADSLPVEELLPVYPSRRMTAMWKGHDAACMERYRACGGVKQALSVHQDPS